MAREITGKVTSNSANKTITVRVDTRKTHPLYRKQYTSTNTIAAHDKKNEAEVGDTVVIQETTPISKSKRWLLLKVLESQQKLEEEK